MRVSLQARPWRSRATAAYHRAQRRSARAPQAPSAKPRSPPSHPRCPPLPCLRRCRRATSHHHPPLPSPTCNRPLHLGPAVAAPYAPLPSPVRSAADVVPSGVGHDGESRPSRPRSSCSPPQPTPSLTRSPDSIPFPNTTTSRPDHHGRRRRPLRTPRQHLCPTVAHLHISPLLHLGAPPSPRSALSSADHLRPPLNLHRRFFRWKSPPSHHPPEMSIHPTSSSDNSDTPTSTPERPTSIHTTSTLSIFLCPPSTSTMPTPSGRLPPSSSVGVYSALHTSTASSPDVVRNIHHPPSDVTTRMPPHAFQRDDLDAAILLCHPSWRFSPHHRMTTPPPPPRHPPTEAPPPPSVLDHDVTLNNNGEPSTAFYCRCATTTTLSLSSSIVGCGSGPTRPDPTRPDRLDGPDQ